MRSHASRQFEIAAVSGLALSLVSAPSARADLPGTGIVKDVIGGATGWTFDTIAAGIAGWVLGGVSYFVNGAVDFLRTSARPDVEAVWFAGPGSPYATVRGIAVVLLVGFVLLGVLQGLVHGAAAGMLRRVAGKLPVAVVGMVATTAVAGRLLALTDALSDAVLSGTGGQALHFLSGLGGTAGGAVTGFAAVILGLVAVLAALVLWVELIVRASLVYLLVAISPIGFAATLWPAARGFLRKTVEVLIAVIASKFVICVALSIGVAALAGAGGNGVTETAAAPAVSGMAPSVGVSLATLLIGAVILALAAFSPFLVLRLIPLAEGALVAQGISRGPARAVQAGAATYSSTRTLGRLSGSGGSGAAGASDGANAAPPGPARSGPAGAGFTKAAAGGGGAATGGRSRGGGGRRPASSVRRLSPEGIRPSGRRPNQRSAQRLRAGKPRHQWGRAAMTVESSARTYRFPPLDRTGWLLGLSGAQCLILAAGVVASGALLQAAAPAPAVLTPLVFSVTLAFAGWDGRPAHEQIPPLVRMAVLQLTGKARWTAELPLLSGTVEDGGPQPALPPFLAGLSILDAGPAAWCHASSAAGVAVVHDARQRTVSASLRVRGQGFALLERPEQDRLVAQWGGVLAAFCTERSPVLSVRLSEWAGPAGLGEFQRFAEAHQRKAGSGALQADGELLADAAPITTRHETLVTVTVPARRPRGHRTKHGAADPATDFLLDQLRLLADRLESADVAVEGPLSPVQTAEVLRLRCDPALGGGTARGRAGSLAAMAGLVSRYNCGPLAAEIRWSDLRVDAAHHRTYWVAEWPRLEVPAGWLEPLLLHPGGVRTFALHCEPVPPSRSRRGVDRDATRLAADGEQRSRAGFRVGARHRRSEVAVLEREAEARDHGEPGRGVVPSVPPPPPDRRRARIPDGRDLAADQGTVLLPRSLPRTGRRTAKSSNGCRCGPACGGGPPSRSWPTGPGRTARSLSSPAAGAGTWSSGSRPGPSSRPVPTWRCRRPGPVVWPTSRSSSTPGSATPTGSAARRRRWCPGRCPAATTASWPAAGWSPWSKRKSIPDLAGSVTNGKLHYALGDLAALPRAAVVVEDRYSALFKQGHARPAAVADALAKYQIRWSAIPIVFCETRSLAEGGPTSPPPGNVPPPKPAAQDRTATTDPLLLGAPDRPEPTVAEVRAWARRAGLDVPDRGRLRPEIWSAWRTAH